MRRSFLVVLSVIVVSAVVGPLRVGADDPLARGSGDKLEGERFFGKKHKKNPQNTRSVSGVVTDPDGELVEGAVVQLKDTKTLQIRSFITLEDGAYRFHGLNTDVDYELKATHEGASSKTRRLSVYDSRKKVTINLKLKGKVG